MAIEGPLKELGIHDVFQLLDLSRKTGALRVTSELRDDEGFVLFDGGRIIHASVGSNPTSIERILRQAGQLTGAERAGGGGARRPTRPRRRHHTARAGAAAPAGDRERGVRADVVARGVLLLRGA